MDSPENKININFESIYTFLSRKTNLEPQPLKKSGPFLITKDDFERVSSIIGEKCIVEAGGLYTSSYYYHSLDGTKMLIHVCNRLVIPIYKYQIVYENEFKII
jgi:hypothetical protein